MIPTVTVSADKHPKYSTDPGNATQDQVFLLSITEANKYFSSDSARQCKPTDFALARGAHVDSATGNCRWWLRTSGVNQARAANIGTDGAKQVEGRVVSTDYIGVRPAMWIDLSANK